MDEFNSFFDFTSSKSTESKREVVSGGYLNGRIKSECDYDGPSTSAVKREFQGPEYASKYQRAEINLLQTFSDTASTCPITSHIDDIMSVDEFSDDEAASVVDEEHSIYNKYKFEHNPLTHLAIYESKDKIMQAIRENPVIVLQGATGCGKTTQVPQYILDDACNRRVKCNIVITQPRRIATISIAGRVAQERKWELPSIVGYQVGLKNISTEDTRMLFCTTGVLLQKLITKKTLQNYTHVILDEVHERDQDMDFLLIIIRRLLATNSPKVKIIIMSATIDATLFSEYFKTPKRGIFLPAPILNVEKKNQFYVKQYYADDLKKLHVEDIQMSPEPGISDIIYRLAIKLILIFNILEGKEEDVPAKKHVILLFLPGIHEIEHMNLLIHRHIILADPDGNRKYCTMTLHSSISKDEQAKVFKDAPDGVRKIILATNIAESSVTVPRVKYVIDFCLTKYLHTDTSTNTTSLKLDWASKNSCDQRSGRAGRTMNGRAYRLVPQYFYRQYMPDHSKPEILRNPLTHVTLKAKMLDMGQPASILALAMDQPNLSDIVNTILLLKEAGALLKTLNGTYTEFDGELTYIGRIMSALPIDIKCSRLIIFGYCFSVLNEAIIMAASLNVNNTFYYNSNNAYQSYSERLRYANGSGSDLFALLNAYKCWKHKCDTVPGYRYSPAEKNFASNGCINLKALYDIQELIRELEQRLEHSGIKEATGVNRAIWDEREKAIILKIIISGAFYPNYFAKSGCGAEQFERSSYKVLAGRDPCNTVYFTGFDDKYIRELYGSNIVDLFKKYRMDGEPRVYFDYNSSKIFVTFVQKQQFYDNIGETEYVSTQPGRVITDVYRAVKMRKLRVPMEIKVLQSRDALECAEERNLVRGESGRWIHKQSFVKELTLICLPRFYDKKMSGYVTYVEHCNKFWFQPIDEQDTIESFRRELNDDSTNFEPFYRPEEVKIGQILAAPQVDEKNRRIIYYRAKVIGKMKILSEWHYHVNFIDYGNYTKVKFDDLRKIRGDAETLIDIPGRIFQCSLAELKPSSIHNPTSLWANDIIEMFRNMTKDTLVVAHIFSVVNGVANVYLIVNGNNINEFLIDRKVAQYTEEPYMSKYNHDYRIRRQKENSMNREADVMDKELFLYIEDECLDDIEPPPERYCNHRVTLNGPHSPLETTIYSINQSTYLRSSTIEQHSVNSVILDGDPQDPRETFIVATSVMGMQSKDAFVARNTTLLPNIPGFAAFMAMIFCPEMDLKRDEHKTRYISLLTGLGWDRSDGKSLFIEHDVKFNLDIEITQRDIELINQIRYSMDSLLSTAPGQERPEIPRRARDELTKKIKFLIIKLLEQQRNSVEVRYTAKHLWNSETNDDMIYCRDLLGEQAIFPLHSARKLYSANFEENSRLRIHCQELHEFSNLELSSLPRHVKCQLCEETVENMPQLRIHLLSRLHKDRETQIEFMPKE